MRFLSEINSPADLRQLKVEDLQEVADEVRAFMLETCSRFGGHTGASLGAVELAVAMHYAFDTPRDRLVWDVGHQAYAHKILTGRRDELHTIKQYGGLSGFLRREESNTIHSAPDTLRHRFLPRSECLLHATRKKKIFTSAH
jgi:1-deoxy-D-xylulose-5-phosphate synthase